MPEERKFCERFIDSIHCNDPALLAALANVRKDDGPEGMMNNFEKMLAYLIPCCPAARSRKSSSSNNFQAQVSAFEMKKGKGRTGVDFASIVIRSINNSLQLRRESSKSIEMLKGRRGHIKRKGGLERVSRSMRRGNLARKDVQIRKILIRKSKASYLKPFQLLLRTKRRKSKIFQRRVLLALFPFPKDI